MNLENNCMPRLLFDVIGGGSLGGGGYKKRSLSDAVDSENDTRMKAYLEKKEKARLEKIRIEEERLERIRKEELERYQREVERKRIAEEAEAKEKERKRERQFQAAQEKAEKLKSVQNILEHVQHKKTDTSIRAKYSREKEWAWDLMKEGELIKLIFNEGNDEYYHDTEVGAGGWKYYSICYIEETFVVLQDMQEVILIMKEWFTQDQPNEFLYKKWQGVNDLLDDYTSVHGSMTIKYALLGEIRGPWYDQLFSPDKNPLYYLNGKPFYKKIR